MENRHGVGIGFQSSHIATDSAGSFGIRSFPVSYTGRYGGEWAAQVRLSVFFPLRANQDDISFSPRAEYDGTQQFDTFVAPNLRFTEVYGWDIDSGLGAHFHYVRFHSTRYVEWSSAAMGLGIATSARTPIGKEFWNGRGELGVHGDLSYDFIDLSRGGDLTGAVQGQLMVSISWAMGLAP